MTLRERMEAEAKFLDSEGIRRSFLASQLIGTPDYEKTRDVGRVYRFIADRIREAINMHDIEMKEGSLMERQAEYGERGLLVCPILTEKQRPWYCLREDCAWWTGTECAVASIAKRGRGIDVKITPPTVPGL